LGTSGKHGSWSPDGNPKAKTYSGLKPLLLSYSSSAYAPFQAWANTSSFMATTEGSWKAGGKGPVPTNPPTVSSTASSSLQKVAIGLTIYTKYIPSVQNPADAPSRGCYPSPDLLLNHISIPAKVQPFLIDVQPR
jgi:hypothetical protein